MDKKLYTAAALIFLSFVLGVYIYPIMPDKMVSHWNYRNEPDGLADKLIGVFILPTLSTLFFMFLLAVPEIDPLRKNIQEFRDYYNGFILVFVFFMFYIHLLIILWNLGYRFNMLQTLSPAFSLLFYYIGVLVSKAKRNWFIGVRTPWTLSNDIVWEKTHKLGGRLFKLCGAAALGGLFIPHDYSLFFILTPILLTSAYLLIYSYIEYRKQTRDS